MKIAKSKISQEFLKRGSFKHKIKTLLSLILVFNLTYCQKSTNQEKERQEKIALASLISSQSTNPQEELNLSQKPTNLKIRRTNALEKSNPTTFSATRSSLKLGDLVFETIEFGDGESLEIQYTPVFDEFGALLSATNSNIQYKSKSSERLVANSCETNPSKELTCRFSENLSLTVFLESQGETMESLLEKKLKSSNSNSNCSSSVKNTKYGARWTTEQWIIAFLWWDCFVLGNPNSCNWLSVLYCPVTNKAVQTPSCDSSGVCYCPIYEVNCRNEYIRQVGQTRFY